MLNLVAFRADAAYPPDHACAAETLSGAAAYARHGRESGAVFARVCGRRLWSGRPEGVLIGPADDAWDVAFVAYRPDAAAFLEMASDAAYRAAVVNRQAGVGTLRLIRCAPGAASGFG